MLERFGKQVWLRWLWVGGSLWGGGGGGVGGGLYHDTRIHTLPLRTGKCACSV